MSGMVPALRHAICNEIFQGCSFAQAAKAICKAGYAAIEIAPYTLAADPASLSPAARRECRDMLASEGLEFAGFHWLLMAPKGLHVTTPDRALRDRSWDYLRRIIDLCSDFGGGVLVFGSPKQRSATGGLTPAQAARNLAEGLAEIAPYAAERGAAVLLEALSPDQTGVVTSLDEAAAIVRQIGHPGVQMVFDTHNAVAEAEPHEVLLDRHFDLVRHVHVNEMDGRQPGSGSYDFRPVLEVLNRRGYAGWISLEVFDMAGDAAEIAAGSLQYLESVARRIGK
jgi:D-psicose/D-tagatose/L-ribulose 3-epimerase